ncbi:GPI inositol-deacylase-like [Anneissia japonica]|uniref:GPI inositol-deacylase-like n=1 Tax=Anneissia japonica TaxID=1529436 RepID=UPI001425AE93|nr:GPI inositol-deacylase-like [Anneissia japonica]
MAAHNKLLCAFLLSLFTWGVYDVLVNVEQNNCSMTYMFQNPVYLPVPGMKNEVKVAFPRYSLYLYGEGEYAQQSRNMKLKGVPVLFIPGNAGSYKQVRSLGSVALRKAARYSFHFNYFSVDLDGELAGMYGGFLQDQTEYVAHCIEHILSLYQHLKNPPTNVIIVGHSMGGLVARALFLTPNFNPKLVSTIITQATPHDSPVVKADKDLDKFQLSVNKFWREHWNSSSLEDVVLVSVGGGFRDNLVRSGLTTLADVFHSSRSLSVVTSAIPNVWLSTDHLCVVWCKELVLATKRAMFDMVDKKTKQISSEPAQRMKMLKKHLSSNNNYQGTDKNIQFKASDKFKVVDDGVLQLDGPVAKETIHYLFPLKDTIEEADHFIAVGNIQSLDWVSVCVKVDKDRCTEAISLKSYNQMLPPRNMGMKKILLATIGLKDAMYLVLQVPKGKKAFVSAELYNSETYAVQCLLPGFFSLAPQICLNETVEGSSFHRVYLDEIYTPGVAYKANLEVLSCDSAIDNNLNSTLHFHVPWSSEDSYSVQPAEENNEISLKLINGRPADDERKSELFVHINPKCQYRLSVQYSHQEGFGQLVRFHSTCLPCFITVIVILVLSYQLKQLRTNEPLHDFIWIQSSYCKPFVVAPFVSIIRAAIRWEPLTSTYDITEMERKNIFFGTLPIVMFLFAYAMVCLGAQLMLYKTKCLGHLYFFLSRTPISNPAEPATLQAGIPWMLYSCVGVLIALAASVSGTLSLILALCMSIAHVSKKYTNVICIRNCMNLTQSSSDLCNGTNLPSTEEDQSESETEEPKDDNGSDDDADKESKTKTERKATPLDIAEDVYNYHFTLMMLLLCMVVINMPSLIVWANHLKYAYSLPTDPARFTSLAVCSAFAILIDPNKSLPTNIGFAKFASRLIYIFTIAMVLYAIESMYRLSYFVAATFVIAAVIQL